MEAIIRDGLHATAYSFQATLSNGTRPDCLISLPDSELHLVIDAKFPLEAFNALKAAKGEADIARRRSAPARRCAEACEGHCREIPDRRRDA